jgi:hypothetical protein
MRVAEALQRACGDGRISLDEFTVRVGDAWAADTDVELAKATGGLAPAPTVGTTQVVGRVLSIFSAGERRGPWRLRSGHLRMVTVFGSSAVDLREARSDSDVIEITGVCVFGTVDLTVPEGVEVEISGAAVFASREVDPRRVPRVPGTPVLRIGINTVFGRLHVHSREPLGSLPPGPER